MASRITAIAVNSTDPAALGATPVDVGQGPATDEMTWHVLADPEGNEFCLLASTVAALGT